MSYQPTCIDIDAELTEENLLRFYEYINKNGPTKIEILGPCWIWTGYLNHNGYGRISISSKRVLAHRLSKQIHHGNVKVNDTIDHLCKNRCCVNPDHLEIVTHEENNKRGMSTSAINMRKTHCKRGHEFSEENTLLWKKGESKYTRQCKICIDAGNKEFKDLPKKPKPSKEELEDLLKIYTKRDVSRQFGCYPTTVDDWVRDYGIVYRRAHKK